MQDNNSTKNNETQKRENPFFLPYGTLKHHYPVLEQHRWLTPLMEVRRWGKLVFCGGLKRSVRELRCNSATPRQQASETQSLLSVLNL